MAVMQVLILITCAMDCNDYVPGTTLFYPWLLHKPLSKPITTIRIYTYRYFSVDLRAGPQVHQF